MKLTKHQRQEFETLARQMSDWIDKNCHPYVKAIVDSTSAELVEGLLGFPFDCATSPRLAVAKGAKR